MSLNVSLDMPPKFVSPCNTPVPDSLLIVTQLHKIMYQNLISTKPNVNITS